MLSFHREDIFHENTVLVFVDSRPVWTVLCSQADLMICTHSILLFCHLAGDDLVIFIDRTGACPAVLTVIADQTAGELLGCLVGISCPYLQFQLFIGFLILHTDSVKVFIHNLSSYAIFCSPQRM